ncbi:MAG: DUF3078 domain-containing protein [Saprospiraceae bacterium]|nr:DUF3078 domain-containing protein [Saprospiraceae bacterium]MDW8485216.1 DUF3078 domain-containing protein [Saprospiraceae bacterium]
MRTLLLLFASIFAFISFAHAQNPAASKDTTWRFQGGLGFDLSGLGIINPRVGAGTNRLAVGGLGTLSANRLSARSFWRNQLSLQLVLQQQGRTSPTQPTGFLKNLDVLRLTSTYGYKVGAGDKWFISADLLAQSQLLPTYQSNYLRATRINGKPDRLVANFLSPLITQFSPGITFKPNKHLSFQYSPAAVRFIYVADDSLAILDIHGNEVKKDAQGNILEYNNFFLGLGSELIGRYENKYFNDRLAVVSSLRLFSNYLDKPQNLVVLFSNNFSLQLFKGLSLDLLGEAFYDPNLKMIIDANENRIYGDDGDRQAPATQLTGAFMLKYNVIF